MTTILACDARSTGLATGSIHCIATSPPYWGLRKYDDDPRQIGNEETPEQYVEAMRAVGREAWRVLRDDGVFWLNLGDTYASSGGHTSSGRSARCGNTTSDAWPRGTTSLPDGIPSGNLVGIPWRVAFALQADGWILRAAIPWVKANGMPESVRNRPTVSHEYVFMLAKAPGYFYDQDALRLPHLPASIERYKTGLHCTADPNAIKGSLAERRQAGAGNCERMGDFVNPAGRNLRTGDFTTWSVDEYAAHVERVRRKGGLLLSPDGEPLLFDVNPVPYKGAHFAAWPPRLVGPMIELGTSSAGCCASCGAPWRRRVEKVGEHKDRWSKRNALAAEVGGTHRERTHRAITETVGFSPSCSCPPSEPVPCTVLDPFGGSGTTAQVAAALGRDYVLCEINEAYHPLIRERLETRLNPADWRPVPQVPPGQVSLF